MTSSKRILVDYYNDGKMVEISDRRHHQIDGWSGPLVERRNPVTKEELEEFFTTMKGMSPQWLAEATLQFFVRRSR